MVYILNSPLTIYLCQVTLNRRAILHFIKLEHFYGHLGEFRLKQIFCGVAVRTVTFWIYYNLDEIKVSCLVFIEVVIPVQKWRNEITECCSVDALRLQMTYIVRCRIFCDDFFEFARRCWSISEEPSHEIHNCWYCNADYSELTG